MADNTRSGAVTGSSNKGCLEWVEEHRQQVRLWFAGLPDEDRREIVELVRKHPLLTYHELRTVAERRQPR